ncbi:hypothetical protein B6U91_01935 [Candidatus Pacearchaeota archaeon ex4484_71]|nr:MAG: hypothetical protein B6U91_01935 [Candidatus Pacearchaeota archaeon ex4484_71]
MFKIINITPQGKDFYTTIHIFFGTAYGPTVEKALWKSDTKNLEVLVAGNIPFSREEIVSNEEVGTMIGLGDKDFEQMREEQQKYTKAIKDYLESRGFKEGENLTIKIPNTPIKGTYSVLVDTVEGKISSKIELLEDTL